MFLGKKKDAGAWKVQGNGAELRGHPRMAIKTLVAVRANRRKEANCRLQDISIGGLGLIAPWSLAIGESVSLTLGAPPVPKAPKTPAFIDARVCRVVPSTKEPGSFQTGVRFESLTEEADVIVRLWFDFFGETIEKKPARR